MLVLTRKCGEEILIGDSIKVAVVKIDGNKVRVGIDAPRSVAVHRPEAMRKRVADDILAEDRPLRILVVDDSPEDRIAYRRIINAGNEREFLVAEAESGEEGLARCWSDPPDCLLLDYLLPDLNGLEFMDELSGKLGNMPCPVVMLTGHGDETVAVQAMKRGAQNYLVKRDITGERLRLAVREARMGWAMSGGA